MTGVIGLAVVLISFIVIIVLLCIVIYCEVRYGRKCSKRVSLIKVGCFAGIAVLGFLNAILCFNQYLAIIKK